MKSDYIYGFKVFLSFVSPLLELLQPRKSGMRQGTESSKCSAFEFCGCPVLTFYFHRISLLKSGNKVWGGIHFQKIMFAKQNATHFS